MCNTSLTWWSTEASILHSFVANHCQMFTAVKQQRCDKYYENVVFSLPPSYLTFDCYCQSLAKPATYLYTVVAAYLLFYVLTGHWGIKWDLILYMCFDYEHAHTQAQTQSNSFVAFKGMDKPVELIRPSAGLSSSLSSGWYSDVSVLLPHWSQFVNLKFKVLLESCFVCTVTLPE